MTNKRRVWGNSELVPIGTNNIAVWLKDQLVFVELSSEEATTISGNPKAIHECAQRLAQELSHTRDKRGNTTE